MPHDATSPVDLPDPEDRRGLAWTAIAMAIAGLILLAMNLVSLQDWIDDQPPGPLQARAAEIVDQGVVLADRIGLGRPRAVLHDQWKRAEAARFQKP